MPATEQPQPIELRCDLAASVAALRASASPESAQHTLSRMLSDAARGAWLAGHAAGVNASIGRMEAVLPEMLAKVRAQGRREGQRQIVMPPELVESFKAFAESRPVVNVAAPNVTVDNHVEVPQRKIRARPDGQGGTIMEPVE